MISIYANRAPSVPNPDCARSHFSPRVDSGAVMCSPRLRLKASRPLISAVGRLLAGGSNRAKSLEIDTSREEWPHFLAPPSHSRAGRRRRSRRTTEKRSSRPFLAIRNQDHAARGGPHCLVFKKPRQETRAFSRCEDGSSEIAQPKPWRQISSSLQRRTGRYRRAIARYWVVWHNWATTISAAC